jgi:hypothetical protein
MSKKRGGGTERRIKKKIIFAFFLRRWMERHLRKLFENGKQVA